MLLLADAAVALARGELAQRQDAFDLTITEERYLQRCRLKTATLFECAVSLGHDDHELRRFGAEVGLAFQLLDDVLDVTGPPERTGKARGTDLLDGTVTLPLIVAAERDPGLREIDLPRARPGGRRGGLRTDRRDRGAGDGAGAGARSGRRRASAALGATRLRRRTAPAARTRRRRRGPALQLIHERPPTLVTIDEMLGNIGPLEIIVVLIIALIVFGPKRLPELGNSLGKGIREFKDSVTGDNMTRTTRRTTRNRSAPQGDHHAGQTARRPTGSKPTRSRPSPTAKSEVREGMPRRVRAVSHEDQLSLVDHLDELRHRIVVCLVVFGVALALCFWQNHLLLEIAQHPLPVGHKKLTTFGVTEPFTTTLTVSAYGAAILSAPFVLWQLYAYILPAFSPSERRVVLPILLLFPFLFIAGDRLRLLRGDARRLSTSCSASTTTSSTSRSGPATTTASSR